MVSGTGAYAWVKGDAERLSGIINLLRDRSWKSDPARIRTYLSDDTAAPEVRKSAALFAERTRDEAAIPSLVKMLRATSTPNPDIFFALVSLNPRDQWIADWTKALAQSPAESKSGQDFRDKLILTLRVAAKLARAIGRSTFGREPDSRKVEFSATAVSLAIENGARFGLDRNWGRAVSETEYQVTVAFPGQEGVYIIDEDLLLDAGALVLSKLCAESIANNSIAGVSKLLNALTPQEKSFSTANYRMKVTLKGQSRANVEIDNTAFAITNNSAEFSLRALAGQEVLMASWRTDDGVTKTGAVKSIDNPREATFSLSIMREDQ